jgi:hypothetical protein
MTARPSIPSAGAANSLTIGVGHDARDQRAVPVLPFRFELKDVQLCPEAARQRLWLPAEGKISYPELSSQETE